MVSSFLITPSKIPLPFRPASCSSERKMTAETKAAGDPRCVVLFSGKRKSGKDYVTDIIRNRLGDDKCVILRLSGPLKNQYAKEHNLDFERLLDASEYKEKYRADMIKWGEEKRNADPGFFCRLVAEGPGSEKAVWLISDARRVTDVKFFQEEYPGLVATIRVTASEATRKKRGWVFTKGVDDVESECGLDSGVNWDFTVFNDDEPDKLESDIVKLMNHIEKRS